MILKELQQLTTHELARLLRVRPATRRRWRVRGRGPRWRRFTASRNGRPAVRYAYRDVEVWLANRAEGGEVTAA